MNLHTFWFCWVDGLLPTFVDNIWSYCFHLFEIVSVRRVAVKVGASDQRQGSLYDVLGVDKNASEQEIKKARFMWQLVTGHVIRSEVIELSCKVA